MSETYSSIDPARYREVMGHYPTGVTVVTGTAEDGGPEGMVVGTFTAVSLDPPLVAFLPTTGSRTFSRLRTSPAFCINVLAHDQASLCRTMSSPSEDKFKDLEWSHSALGAPVITEAVAHIHCLPVETIEAGDHYIQLCRVDSMEVSRQVPPLLFFQGGYGAFSPHSMTARGDADLIAGIRLADYARAEVEALAQDLGCEAAVLVAVDDDELTTAATAYGGKAVMRELIGERLPMKPPLGEAYVAWSSVEHIERWLALAGKDPDLVAMFRRRLNAIRAQGYAAWQMQCDGDPARVSELMVEYTAGGLTPARERSLLLAMSEAMTFVDTADFSADLTYDIGGLMAPVINRDGSVALLVRLAQLQQQVPGSVVQHWVAQLQAAAASIESTLWNSSPTPDHGMTSALATSR